MSSILIKRGLGVAGVTGGLLLVGAGVSLADDGSATDSFGLSQGSGEAAVSAPISLGGLSLGLATGSAQSSGSSTTTTTDEGTATETRQDASQTSSDLGIDVGEITVDPAAMLSGATASQQSSGDDAAAGTTSTEGVAEVAAPVSVGGVALTGSTTSQDASAHGSTVTDDQGASVTEGATSTSSSTTSGVLGLGETTLDPVAVLDGSAWSAGSASDARDDAAAGTSGGTGDVDLSSPVNLGGLTAGITDERGSADEAWTMRADGDGDAAWTRTETADESATSLGLTTGELTADPAAWLQGSTVQALGARDDAAEGASATPGDLGVATPIMFGGADAWLTDERASWSSATEGVRTDDVTRESTSERTDATRTGGALGLGQLALLPELAATGDSATRSGADDEAGTVLGTADGMLDLTAPLWFDGARAAGTLQSESATKDTDTLTTDEGTTSTSTWSSAADTVDPSLATGPVQGDLAGWVWGELTGLGARH